PASSPKAREPLKDYEVIEAPKDTVTSLEFTSKTCSFVGLCAASWDDTIRLWDVQMASGEATPMVMKNLSHTAFSTTWNPDGTKIYLGDCMGKVFVWDLASEKMSELGSHAKGVKSCHLVTGNQSSYLMTASWDKTVKFWDPRTAVEAASMDMPERCYAADLCHPLAVVACADGTIVAISLETGPVERDRFVAPRYGTLSNQVRSVAIYKGSGERPVGWALGRNDGRVCFQHLMNKTSRDFTLKCHVHVDLVANMQDTYPVHDVRFHPVHQTMASVGSEGQYQFWDPSTRCKILQGPTFDQPLTKCSISGDGELMAYALGYDWAKGYTHFDTKKKPHIFLHPVGTEMKPKFQ
ncbi:hypothetical protein KR009_003167, partial [Drosophila setifemur]